MKHAHPTKKQPRLKKRWGYLILAVILLLLLYGIGAGAKADKAEMTNPNVVLHSQCHAFQDEE
jgi:hypothetical protein